MNSVFPESGCSLKVYANIPIYFVKSGNKEKTIKSKKDSFFWWFARVFVPLKRSF